MKELFLLLQQLDYDIHHKRILGNELYTSTETKLSDISQELGLVIKWINDKHDKDKLSEFLEWRSKCHTRIGSELPSRLWGASDIELYDYWIKI